MHLVWEFDDRAGDSWVRLKRSPTNRRLAECPACSEHCIKLYLVDGSWGCRRCLGLRSRSSSMAYATRTAALEPEGKQNRLLVRPKGMTHSRFRNLRRKNNNKLTLDRQLRAEQGFKYEFVLDCPSLVIEYDLLLHRHLEAYPRIAADELSLTRWPGRVKLWEDSRGREIGALELIGQNGDQASFRYDILGRPGLGGHTGQCEVTINRDPINGRQRVRCPDCAAWRSALIFHQQRWACRECCGLYYRSSLLDSRVRKAEQAKRLAAELSRPARTGGTARDAQVKEGKLARLRDQLGARWQWPSTNVELEYRIEARWTSGQFSAGGHFF